MPQTTNFIVGFHSHEQFCIAAKPWLYWHVVARIGFHPFKGIFVDEVVCPIWLTAVCVGLHAYKIFGVCEKLFLTWNLIAGS